MTALLRTDLNDFLLAPIADDATGMPLTMLTALARKGVDPWVEAADLADLPREAARQKVISLLAQVPNGPAPGDATEVLASHLVTLLHSVAKRQAPVASAPPPAVAMPAPVPAPAQSRSSRRAIYYLLALIVALGAQWVMSNRQALPAVDTSMPTSP